MLRSEMQHQFWITKKTVQRKLGSKEDEHIISSDAELDAKIEVFKSISSSSVELSKIIDQYQENICVLAQEESIFGRFLKETGKRSKTTRDSITSVGKAMSYCGQQRMYVRAPLLRLQHEVDVFRCRAITDMQNTIAVMEKERTEYRAALEWMKSASTELDPDTGRGLNKFRTAQTHVRNAKQLFDSLTMDSIQKIDLLAAARCNMFSHVLVSYMSELRQFAQKSNTTLEAISKALEQKPHYDFCILKDLTQFNGSNEGFKSIKTSSFDKDQSLFFAEAYMDNESELKDFPHKLDVNNFREVSNNAENITNLCNNNQDESVEGNGLDISVGKETSADVLSKILSVNDLISPEPTPISPTHYFTGYLTENKRSFRKSETTLTSSKNMKNEKIKSNKNVKTNSWIELFADLDPLANLEAFDSKLSGASKNFQQT